ncbi:MAG: hypothetical protein IJ856_01640 [Candidatus Methanomethylophilaceae archaeon]|nr:hypothetical protein [Candidatus Methanomethylophilaceae archaeon]
MSMNIRGEGSSTGRVLLAAALLALLAAPFLAFAPQTEAASSQEISEKYTVTILVVGGNVYLAPLAEDGKMIPAGEYSIAVNYIATNPRSGSLFVAEGYIEGKISVPVGNGTIVPIDVSGFSNIVAYTPVYTVDGVETIGLTVNV